MAKYFRIPFASSGEKITVPDTPPGDGTINYTQGYPSGYSSPPPTPGYKFVERKGINDVFYDVTLALQQYQQNGAPDFITSSDNGGTAFPYALGALTRRSNIVYQSLVANNTTTPPSGSWGVIGYIPPGTYITPNDLQQSNYIFAIATGTSNAIILTPSVAYSSLSAGTRIIFRAASSNTSSVTVNISALGAKSIVVTSPNGGSNIGPLKANMITQGGIYSIVYDGSNFQLENPSIGYAFYSTLALGSSFNITGNSWQNISYSARSDPFGWFNPVDYSIRPTFPGLFTLTVSQYLDNFSDNSNFPALGAFINGTEYIRICQGPIAMGDVTICGGAQQIPLDAGDYLQIGINLFNNFNPLASAEVVGGSVVPALCTLKFGGDK